MKNIIKTQRLVMLNKQGIKIAFSLMLAGQMLIYISHVLQFQTVDRFLSVMPTAAFSLGIWGSYSSIITFLMPFLAVFPFVVDTNVKETELYLARTSFREYYIAKAIVSFEGAFLITFLPLVLGIGLNAITFYDGINGVGEAARYSLYEEELLMGGSGFPLVGLFISHPLLYEILWSLFCSVVCGIIAVFSLSCSLFIKKHQVLLLLPFYVIVTIAAQIPLGSNDLDSTAYINKSFYQYLSVGYYSGRNYLMFFLILLFLIGISVIFMVRKIRIVEEEGI